MIDVKEAAQIAAQYFADLYPNPKFSDLLLEEVEYDEEKNTWLITLGYSVSNAASALSLRLPDPRKYKIFNIDAETGKVLSMKIRTLENA